MDEFQYLEKLGTEELVNIIEEMLDYEEVTSALMVLIEKDINKAIQLGFEIISENKGDDYLQATTWDITFPENREEMLKALSNRNSAIGKVLLNDIITELVEKKISVQNDLVELIKERYEFFSLNKEDEFQCDYVEFCQMYF